MTAKPACSSTTTITKTRLILCSAALTTGHRFRTKNPADTAKPPVAICSTVISAMDAEGAIGDTTRVGDGQDRPASGAGGGSGSAARDLVTTPAAAATLGISARTLQRYVEQGLLTPSVTLPSGQYRWDPAALARQVAALADDHDAGLADRPGSS